MSLFVVLPVFSLVASFLSSAPLAGHGGGLLPKTGRQIRYPDVPLGNLWLTLAQLAGSERKKFGRSTGTLSGLG